MKYSYKTKGVCSRQINVEIEDNKIIFAEFIGGCHGNTQGVAALAIGMDVDDYISRCENIKCGYKTTSCPAQLAEALKEARSAE